LGVNKDKQVVKNITEMLHEKGYVTSLIATSEITHATPAAFVVHNESRDNTDQIAEQLFRSNNFISLGGGRDFFIPEDLGGQREDDLDILALIKEEEAYLGSRSDLINFQLDPSKRIFGLFSKEGFIREESEPDLLEMLDFSLEQSNKMISNNCTGFFIMAEGSQIDWEGHENNFDGVYKEMDEFSRVVDRALKFAESNQDTLVIVLSDHETGGLLIETDTWERNPQPRNKMKISWNTAVGLGTHTGTMIPVFAYGPGAENIGGVMDNTDIFFIMEEALGIDNLAERKCL
jgi:alkaline phosphatase